jgi:hypothetical protein
MKSRTLSGLLGAFSTNKCEEVVEGPGRWYGTNFSRSGANHAGEAINSNSRSPLIVDNGLPNIVRFTSSTRLLTTSARG